MKQVVRVDVWNMSLTNDVGRCLSTSGGGLNEHIPIVIIREINETTNRHNIRPSHPCLQHRGLGSHVTQPRLQGGEYIVINETDRNDGRPSDSED